MQASLSVMARRLPGAPVLAAAEWLYRMFCDDAYLMGQRKAAVQLMLLPLLGSASDAVLVDFYAKHAADVTAIVAAPLPLYGWGPRAAGGRAQLGSLWLANQAGNHELRGGGGAAVCGRRSDPAELVRDVSRRICAFDLLQLAYTRLSATEGVDPPFCAVSLRFGRSRPSSASRYCRAGRCDGGWPRRSSQHAREPDQPRLRDRQRRCS